MSEKEILRFSKELYPRIALIKAAYNYTDRAYVHLDAIDDYYIVTIQAKEGYPAVCEEEFINEMLTQSVRHAVYEDTKTIRELTMARAMAACVMIDNEAGPIEDSGNEYTESDILKDWFAK